MISDLEKLNRQNEEENVWMLNTCDAGNKIISKLIQLNEANNNEPKLEEILSYLKK
jgi:hypothetical protein